MISSSGGSSRRFPPTTVSVPPAPPPANTAASDASSSTTTKAGACLRATILTAYDLPIRDPPARIRLTIGNNNNNSLTTGPPIQRHKDRNSFRFHSSSNNSAASSNLVIRCDKLEELYDETAVLTVEYPQETQAALATTTPSLTARYKLSQLKIYEVTWLILTLEEEDDDDSDESDEDDDSTLDGNSAGDDNGVEGEGEGQDQEPTPGASEPERTSVAQERRTKKSTTTSVRSKKSRNDNFSVGYSIGWEGEEYDRDLHPPPPTLRLQLTLEGPYRPEVSAIMKMFNGWLGLCNRFEDAIHGLFHRLVLDHFAWWDSKLLLVPAVPLFAAGVVSTPLLVGLCVTFLPMLLPLAVLFSILLAGIAMLATILYASTRNGREHVGNLLQPLIRGMLATNTGQRMVYDTGPRPTPVALCRSFVVPHSMWGKLLVSLTLDGLGSASFLVPILGEMVDVVCYAHVQTLLVMAMYDDIAPNLKYVSFVEEILPFTDLMPSATIGWLKEYGWIPLMQMILQNDKVVGMQQRRKRRVVQDRLRLLAQQQGAHSPTLLPTPITANTALAKRS